MCLVGLLTTSLLLGGCEVFDSDSDSPPEWVGNWQVTALDGQPPDPPRYWSITRQQWDIVEEPTEGTCSVLDRGTITDRTGNVVTVKFENEGTLELELEAKGDRLTSTLVGGPDTSDDVVVAEPIDFDPLARFDCSL